MFGSGFRWCCRTNSLAGPGPNCCSTESVRFLNIFFRPFVTGRFLLWLQLLSLVSLSVYFVEFIYYFSDVVGSQFQLPAVAFFLRDFFLDDGVKFGSQVGHSLRPDCHRLSVGRISLAGVPVPVRVDPDKRGSPRGLWFSSLEKIILSACCVPLSHCLVSHTHQLWW